jgi:hypothetical protein
MSLCARMLARTPGPRLRTWLAADPALDARVCGETTIWSHDGAAVNRPRINDFAPFERPRSGALAACSRGQPKGPMRSEALHGPNIVAVLEQVCRERMLKRLWTHSLSDAGLARRLGRGFLNNGLVEVKPGWRSPSRIGTHARGRKHELPSPFGGGVRIPAAQFEWEDNAPKPCRRRRFRLDNCNASRG